MPWPKKFKNRAGKKSKNPSDSDRLPHISQSADPSAAKIIRGRTDLEGERRTVTVLFADATGFTSMSEHLPAYKPAEQTDPALS